MKKTDALLNDFDKLPEVTTYVTFSKKPTKAHVLFCEENTETIEVSSRDLKILDTPEDTLTFQFHDIITCTFKGVKMTSGKNNYSKTYIFAEEIIPFDEFKKEKKVKPELDSNSSISRLFSKKARQAYNAAVKTYEEKSIEFWNHQDSIEMMTEFKSKYVIKLISGKVKPVFGDTIIINKDRNIIYPLKNQAKTVPTSKT